MWNSTQIDAVVKRHGETWPDVRAVSPYVNAWARNPRDSSEVFQQLALRVAQARQATGDPLPYVPVGESTTTIGEAMREAAGRAHQDVAALEIESSREWDARIRRHRQSGPLARGADLWSLLNLHAYVVGLAGDTDPEGSTDA